MIKIFKLTSSETVIADAEVNLDGHWLLSRPHTITIIPQPTGQLGVALMDFVFGAKDDSTIVLTGKSLMCEPVEPSVEMSGMWDAKMKEILRKDTGIEVVSSL